MQKNNPNNTLEKRIKVLLIGDLSKCQLYPKVIKKWFKESFKYLHSTEDYERAKLLKEAEILYLNGSNHKK